MNCYKPKTKVVVFCCLQCGKKEETPKWKKRKFCSLSCNATYKNTNHNPMATKKAREKASITRKKLIQEKKVKFFGYGMSPSRKGKLNFWFGKKRNGKLNPNWKGGLSFKPYSPDFNKELKEKIRSRDKRVCQLCSRYEKDNQCGKLSVHHIDYDKNNCLKNNLIALCTSCNVKANYERSCWRTFFQSFLEGKYGYEYPEVY